MASFGANSASCGIYGVDGDIGLSRLDKPDPRWHFRRIGPQRKAHLDAGVRLLWKLDFRISSRDLSLEEPMSRRLFIIASALVFSISAASAQAPSPDAMTAARSLVTTMKLPEQYKALLPGILLGLRRELTQDRPEIERDYDTMKPTVEAAFTPYYTAMLNDVATVYANNFTIAEMRDMETFFQRPAGQKYLEKASAVTLQTNRVTQDASRKAADDLRARLTQALREKGHKL
jgi:hypothetical protein